MDGATSIDGRNVLVVEDDPTTCELIAELLMDDGYRVLQTGSGSVGLRLARQYHPQAVVLDMLLGEVSGLDVLRELKSAEPTRDIRVVAISGSRHMLQQVSYGAHSEALRQPRGHRDRQAGNPCARKRTVERPRHGRQLLLPDPVGHSAAITYRWSGCPPS